MSTSQQFDENKALREFIEASRKYVAARDALWSVGFFDRIFRSGRCVDLLNRYDEARDNVKSAIQVVMDATAAKTKADATATVREYTPQNSCPVLTVEEFEMLLDKKPSILRNRPAQAASKKNT